MANFKCERCKQEIEYIPAKSLPEFRNLSLIIGGGGGGLLDLWGGGGHDFLSPQLRGGGKISEP